MDKYLFFLISYFALQIMTGLYQKISPPPSPLPPQWKGFWFESFTQPLEISVPLPDSFENFHCFLKTPSPFQKDQWSFRVYWVCLYPWTKQCRVIFICKTSNNLMFSIKCIIIKHNSCCITNIFKQALWWPRLLNINILTQETGKKEVQNTLCEMWSGQVIIQGKEMDLW